MEKRRGDDIWGKCAWPLCSLTLWGPSCPTPCLVSEAPVTAESGERAHLQRLRGKALTPAPVRAGASCSSVVASSPHL